MHSAARQVPVCLRCRRGAYLGLTVVAVDVGEVRDHRLGVALVGGVDLVDRLLAGRGRRILKQLPKHIGLGRSVRLGVGLGEAGLNASGAERESRVSGVGAARAGDRQRRVLGGRRHVRRGAHLARGVDARGALAVGNVAQGGAGAGSGGGSVVVGGHDAAGEEVERCRARAVAAQAGVFEGG